MHEEKQDYLEISRDSQTIAINHNKEENGIMHR